ncbi:hypothetical protein G7048_27470 (plasmid) [Diaphorobacter sp. HDW4B]|uniref:DUF6493 family protein n=1 Tax=Diaphorobacter sp. HDW4B TaxID=2714925 RepID=UPI00140A6C15|nr:DUF6493 family protein [Diaphorobacter sp. HDW4B]QIL74213.1 hypothetical protein G7048_27470 [Diaphorobacter sp. HDW4B]
MSSYQHEYEFHRDTPRLIESGATLRSLYDAMLTVRDSDMRKVDASPARLKWMTQHWSQSASFVPIRLNELFGGLNVEHTDDYVLALVGGLGGRYEHEVRMFMLRHDHALRNEVFWRVFEVEGGGEISLANIDKFSAENFNWHNTVVLLANEGTLDRQRVLRSCLEALNRDFSAYRAGWFSRVYAALEPTPEQSAADQDLLRLCMGSSVTATLSLGVKQLEAVHKAGLLETDAFVQSCSGAFSGPKAAAVALVRMLASIAASGGADAESTAQALAQALHHPHADVQRAAVKALGKMGRMDLALDQRDSLAPAVVAELLPKDTPAADVEPDEGIAPSPSEQAQCLQQAEPLIAWTDQTAFERYAALLEDGDNALELELAMAWLATSENAANIIAALTKRARAVASRDIDPFAARLLIATTEPDSAFLPQTFWYESSVIDGVWVEDRRHPKPHPTEEESSAMPSFITRLREVAAMAQGQIPRRPLLATPTDSHGWIDIETFAKRCQQTSPATGSLPADLNQALLRVRREDLAQALRLTGADTPRITERIRIEWRGRESDSRKPNGSPMWVFWSPAIHADTATDASTLDPALIPSDAEDDYGFAHGASDLISAQLGLATPASTLALTAVGVKVLNSAAGDEVEHRAAGVLGALAKHPSEWTAETVQLVALGMAAKQAEIRAQACELLAAAIPARLSIGAAAEGFAACAPAIVLTRWTESFADAATLAPSVVIALLTHLLPRMNRQTRGIGGLLTVLLDESLRHSQPVVDGALREWLAGFKGSSAAAKAAKSLLG